MRNQFGNTPLTFESLSKVKLFPKFIGVTRALNRFMKRFKTQKMTPPLGGSIGQHALKI
jgi:hypothetical protein